MLHGNLNENETPLWVLRVHAYRRTRTKNIDGKDPHFHRQDFLCRGSSGSPKSQRHAGRPLRRCRRPPSLRLRPLHHGQENGGVLYQEEVLVVQIDRQRNQDIAVVPSLHSNLTQK